LIVLQTGRRRNGGRTVIIVYSFVPNSGQMNVFSSRWSFFPFCFMGKEKCEFVSNAAACYYEQFIRSCEGCFCKDQSIDRRPPPHPRRLLRNSQYYFRAIVVWISSVPDSLEQHVDVFGSPSPHVEFILILIIKMVRNNMHGGYKFEVIFLLYFLCAWVSE